MDSLVNKIFLRSVQSRYPVGEGVRYTQSYTEVDYDVVLRRKRAMGRDIEGGTCVIFSRKGE